MSLHSEIHEQPQAFRRLLSAREEIQRITDEVQRRAPSYAFLAARGASDNAARYANYLWGAYNRLPVALATPSLFTYYNQPPSLKDALVVGISQSGQSPDIVAVLEEGRRQGCPTLAITNAPGSPLARCADFVLEILAGPEKAVAATKTYTAELLAMAMFSAALAQDGTRLAELEHVPAWSAQILELDGTIRDMAQRFRYMAHCVAIGRGFNYATAFEWSLKLKELSYIVAEPYSSADFQHGPIAIVERGFPVMAVAPGGQTFDSVLELLKQLRQAYKAELVVISDQPEALELAQSPIEMPSGIPEWLSPLLAIIPAQLFCYHLTQARGLDPEMPRSIQKITETR
ncbi:MAG: SIS domain-containing protein [Chloroflexi bacterium]|nr:SIS domain-containing protein [Chloroflexota bacterium]